MKPDRTPEGPQPEVERYRPPRGRQRLVIAVAAVAAMLVVLGSVVFSHIGHQRELRGASPPKCEGTRTEGCVGGRTAVIVGASAAR